MSPYPAEFPFAPLLALLPLSAWLPALAQPGPPPDVFLPGSACQPPGIEAALRSARASCWVLGTRRSMRACGRSNARSSVGQRPVPDRRAPGKPGPVTQQEDAAVLAVANELAAGNEAKASTAAGRAAKSGTSQGRWSDPFTIPVVGITAAPLHTGKAPFWTNNPANYGDPANSYVGVAYVWDPATRTGHAIAPPEHPARRADGAGPRQGLHRRRQLTLSGSERAAWHPRLEGKLGELHLRPCHRNLRAHPQ